MRALALIVLAAACAPTQPPPSEIEEPAQPLRADAVIERGLSDGGHHAYTVALARGDYLRIAVEQQGVDLVLELADPQAGEPPLVVDSPTGGTGEEVAEWVSARGEPLSVTVRAFPGADPGRYSLRVEAIRPAEDRDRDRATAAASYWHAEAARGAGGAEALDRADSGFEDAARRWRALGAAAEEALALRRLGEVRTARGQAATAVPAFERSLALSRRLEDRAEQMRVLNDLADAYRGAGEPNRAVVAGEQALFLARERGDHAGAAVALNNAGLAYVGLGQYQDAIAALSDARSAWEAAGDRRRSALTMENLGACYARIGRTEEGRLVLERALEIERKLDAVRAGTLIELGWVRYLAGEPEAALPFFAEGLERARASGDQVAEAGALDRRGTALRKLGRFREGEADHLAALDLVRRADNIPAIAHTLLNLGAVALQQHERERAEARFREALELAERVADRSAAAVARTGLARALREAGDLMAARALLAAAVSGVESLRASLGTRDLRSSYLAVHLDAFEDLIDLLMELDARQPGAGWDRQAFAVSERARARSLLEGLGEARAGRRVPLASEHLARERALLAEIESMEDRRLELLAAAADDPKAAQLDGEIRLRWLDLETLRAEVERSGAEAGLTAARPLTSEEIQQQLLDPDTQVLGYSLGERSSFVWVVGRDRFVIYRLPGRAAIEPLARDFYTQLKRPPRAAAERQAALVATALSDTILAPAAGQLTGRRLIVLPDGALWYVPFAALPIPGVQGTPLVAEHEIVTLPSASVLAMLRAPSVTGRRRPAMQVAILADPVFSAEDDRVRGKNPVGAPTGAASDRQRAARDVGMGRFERLPWTSVEAEAILAVTDPGRSRAAFAFEANRKLVEGGSLADYAIVHFATHGVIDEEHPERSGLVLSLVDPLGRPQDGFLRVHELFDLDLPADLVVLSACRTALGQEVRGEGLVGLTQAFFNAGARRVLVSLWGVDDQATSSLMGRFYELHVREGLPAAAALRRAQAEMAGTGPWREPYYWAGFTLQGDWR